MSDTLVGVGHRARMEGNLTGPRSWKVHEKMKEMWPKVGQGVNKKEQGLDKVGGGDSPGRSIGDKGWSWTGSWPPLRKTAPHTHSLGRVARMTGWSAESRVSGHHPREGMTPSRHWVLQGRGDGGAGRVVTWPADGAALPRRGVALQAVEL